LSYTHPLARVPSSGQFLVAGKIKAALTKGEVRPLSSVEQVAAGFGAGFSSGVVIAPFELLMIQQQRKGGSLGAHSGTMMSPQVQEDKEKWGGGGGGENPFYSLQV
jgi:hypothetical protein